MQLKNHNEADIYSASWADIISTVIQIYRNWLQQFHLCPEKHAVTRKAEFTKFCQTDGFDDFFETKGF